MTAPPTGATGDDRPSQAIGALPAWMQAKAPIWIPTSDIMPNRLRTVLFLVGIFAGLGWASYAWMMRSFSMYSPGATAWVHSTEHPGFRGMLKAKHLSSDCAACHAGFAAGRESRCQSCHASSQATQKHRENRISCVTCHAEHRGRAVDLALGVGATCQSAGCHVQAHRSPGLIEASGKRVKPSPVASAVAFEANFDFGGDRDVHPKHKTPGVKCLQCHDDAEGEKKVARLVMRSRCLSCHGFGPETSLQARCYSCHFEHPTNRPETVFAFTSFPDEPAPAELPIEASAGVSGWPLLLGSFAAVPLLYLAVSAVGFRVNYGSFRKRTEAYVRQNPLSLGDRDSSPLLEEALAAAYGPQRVFVEPKLTDNQAPGGHLRPQIDLDLCVGCGSCVHVCPFDVLEIVNEKAVAARLSECTGVAACVAECPTNAITLVTGGAMQMVDLPVYGDGLETNIPGLYLAGEVTGKALIKVAINQGKRAVDSIVQKRLRPGEYWDVIVVGAGPAGISAALAAASSGLRVRVLEQGTTANTIRNYSRQKFVMAEPVSIPVYGALWMEDTSKEALLEKWQHIIRSSGLEIQEEERVLRVEQRTDHFLVRSVKTEYQGAQVVLAIGKRGSPRKLGVPGEDSSKVAYNLLEVDAYRGKSICVVGGGDSGIEAANGLARADLGNRVALVHRGADFNRAKGRNQKKIERTMEDGRLTVYFNSAVLQIGERAIVVNTASGRVEVPNDYVFVMAGGESPKQFLSECGIEFSQRALG